MSASYGAVINRMLNGVGFHLVRQSTLDRLISTAHNGHASKQEDEAGPNDDAAEVDHAPLCNEGSHHFRPVSQAGDSTETVPAIYLQNLERESLALREMSAELIKLKLQLAGASGGATSEPSTPDVAGHRLYTPVYDYWGLRTDPAIVHNHDFMRDPRFVAAYERGVVAEGYEPRYFWRTHVALWCASIAVNLGGDFVECGVCRGMLSSSIMHYLDWNNIHRRFFLFDTFAGVDERLVTDEEVASGNLGYFREMYKTDIYEDVVRNFAEYKNVEIIRGSVPSSLSTVDIDAVAYLSIDMNNVTPEIAAIDHFWSKLQPGAPVLLDDYGFVRYEAQKHAFDTWASQHGVNILALPTGQGLMIKPPSAAEAAHRNGAP
ncbi:MULTISPECIES: TylF/MycF/NovP-related O-methyltransferase [unclassified Bradyrhizobium]|uniref:TylF/MycF/NovP-related O-methyltransferase n=1 Tax=unclassified Bradyrhizobium TaxID=2631580 RepID=UPI0028E845D3|nr:MULTISPECIES: TylF/MycF/NovP-related O-methyltransferase [unclassified Bradyrhizobium]